MADLDPVVAVLLVVWLTLFGACIGSFLNVVVYRLPRRKSLSDPPSHCPKCSHPIRWYDNVPVFGWLWLRGKCRDCKEPISIRYPIVEALCGGVFCTISTLVLYRGGDASLMEVFWLVTALSGLVITFLAAGFIEQESKPIPWRLFIPAAVLAPMMPFLVIESFHINIYSLGLELPSLNDNVNFERFFWSIALCFLWSLPFCGLLRNGHRFAWIISATLLSFYFGFGGLAILVFVSFLLLLIYKTSLQNILTPHLILAFSAFGMIVLSLQFKEAWMMLVQH